MHHMPRVINDGSIPGAELVHIVQLGPCIRVGVLHALGCFFHSSCCGLRHAEGPNQLVKLPTGSLVLPAFVRNEYATRSTATCIDPRQEVVNIYLVRADRTAALLSAACQAIGLLS
jgi:hypothetical protein